jgi:hypothetical protein
MPRTILILAALLATAARVAAEPVTATIHGVEAVNLRRGPGTESPAFRALGRGMRVRVEEVDAQWARIKLEDGQTGYVNIAFLQLDPGATFPPAPTATVVAAEAEAVPVPNTPEAVAAETPHGAALEGQIEQLRARLAALESAVVTPQVAPAAAVGTPRPLAPLAAPVSPPEQLDIGPSLALAGVGLVIGFLLGTVYGQRLERHRRSRVRF